MASPGTGLVEKKTTVEEFNELYYRQGYSTMRIAEMLGTNRSSVGRFMIRHILRRRLTKYNLAFDYLPEPKLAYFAGLFDGEGNITVTIDSSGVIRAEVSVCNTDEAILEFRKFFTHYRIRENVGYSGNTRMHVLYTHNFKDVYSLLSAILPYLTLKRARAEFMIRICLSRMQRFREPLSIEERSWVEQIRLMNSRKGRRR